MVNEEIIIRKISKLREYIGELRHAKDITWENYKKNIRDKSFIERYLHLAIQSVFDIANHIISYEGWKEPDSYREIFAILAAHGVLPEGRVSDFQNMASFRNMLVHHYEQIDDELVFGIFKDKLGDFDVFLEMILEFIRKQKES